MKVYNISRKEVFDILREINVKYDGNVSFPTDPSLFRGNGLDFRLTVNDSTGVGSRKSHSGRQIKSACWHVFGDFIDLLFDKGATRVQTGMRGNPDMTSKEQNWINPEVKDGVYYSELCDCNDEEEDKLCQKCDSTSHKAHATHCEECGILLISVKNNN